MGWLERTKSNWERSKHLYGKVALGTYLVLWALVMAAYFVGLRFGFDVSIEPDGEGFWALLAGAWAFSKLSQIPRILLTIALTPIVAGRRVRSPK